MAIIGNIPYFQTNPDRSYLVTTIHGFNRRFSLQHSSTNPTFLYFPEVTVDMSFHTQLGLDVDWANGKSSDICRAVVRWRSGTGSTWEWNGGVSGTTTTTFRALFLVQLGFWKMLLPSGKLT